MVSSRGAVPAGLIGDTTMFDPPVSPRPKGKPWPVAEFASHFSCTTKHARFLMDTGKVVFIRVGKRRRMVPDTEVKRLEKEGV